MRCSASRRAPEVRVTLTDPHAAAFIYTRARKSFARRADLPAAAPERRRAGGDRGLDLRRAPRGAAGGRGRRRVSGRRSDGAAARSAADRAVAADAGARSQKSAQARQEASRAGEGSQAVAAEETGGAEEGEAGARGDRPADAPHAPSTAAGAEGAREDGRSRQRQGCSAAARREVPGAEEQPRRGGDARAGHQHGEGAEGGGGGVVEVGA